MSLDHDDFMSLALEQAKLAATQGNRPIGSVLVGPHGKIVARGGNQVYSDIDPTAHGEMVVLRLAARALGTIDLSGCTLYTSMEPCPMCCWAILEANISRLVLGGRLAGIGRRDVGAYSVETMLAFTGRTLEVVTGIRTRECEELRMAWVAQRAARGLGPR